MDHIMEQFTRGSSPVDWCEENYGISSFVAEFYNTISNVLFFFIAPLMIYLFRQYAVQVTSHIYILWVLFFIVGMGSMYFHATLSLFGQLIDEISIIWVLMAGMALWFPKGYMPLIFERDRKKFKTAMFIFAIVTSVMACIMPAINHFALFAFGVPATWLLCINLKRCRSSRVFDLGIRCAITWVIAIGCWISDRAFCDIWSYIRFPYLHCLWHILICIASYTGCVLFAYFDACDEVPEQMPVMKFWPKDSWANFGVPFVSLKNTGFQL